MHFFLLPGSPTGSDRIPPARCPSSAVDSSSEVAAPRREASPKVVDSIRCAPPCHRHRCLTITCLVTVVTRWSGNLQAVMPECKIAWTLLVYKLPSQPTRLRIQVWRKLQAVGAVYLQDGVAALPSREDLDENLSYIAASVHDLGGSVIHLKAQAFAMKDSHEIVERFRRSADTRVNEILVRLEALSIPEIHSEAALAELEEALKRERLAYLKARRLNYFGSSLEPEVESRLSSIRLNLDAFMRGEK
jgi:hypothetical protein